MIYRNSEGKNGSEEKNGNESPQEVCTKWLCCAFCARAIISPSNLLLPSRCFCGKEAMVCGLSGGTAAEIKHLLFQQRIARIESLLPI